VLAFPLHARFSFYALFNLYALLTFVTSFRSSCKYLN